MCGSSAPPAPTSQTVTQTSIPEYAQPYVERLLGKAEAFSSAPYQAYGGERTAGFAPMQQQAFQNAANLQPTQQLGLGTQMAGLAGLRAGNTYYNPTEFNNQFNAPSPYQAGQFGVSNVNAPNLQQFSMGPAERVTTQSFASPNAAQAYMSPYMESALQPQIREAARQSAMQGQQNQAQAVQQGAFGGSRSAIVEAERQRNLQRQVGDIYGTGMQSAFQNAQQQFNSEQQARLAAQQANQQAGLTVGQQNLAARLGVQQLGANQSMQAAMANQAAAQEAQRAREASRQFGANQGMTAAQLQAQYGMSAQQAQEASRQFGANLGMQGIQQQLASAQALGQLGQTQFGQQKDIINAQAAAGAQQQALQQQILNQRYQDFQAQRGAPQQNLAFMSDILRGVPLGQSTQQQYAAPQSVIGQAAGLGIAALGAKQAGLFGAKGGSVPHGLDKVAIDQLMRG